MDENLNHVLVATYASIVEALVAKQILETAGVPCRLGDDAQLPNALYGMPGTIGRSAALWVLAGDLDRATALLAEMRGGGGVDEAELAEEALASPEPATTGSSWKLSRRAVAFLALVTAGALVALVVH